MTIKFTPVVVIAACWSDESVAAWSTPGYRINDTPFAVHRKPGANSRYWYSTHLPSGYGVPFCHGRTRLQAAERVLRLYRYGKRIGVNWNRKRHKWTRKQSRLLTTWCEKNLGKRYLI